MREAPNLALRPPLQQDHISTEDRMALHIDYYASLNSPWTHMGAARIEAMAAAHDATLRIYPVDFGDDLAKSGGLPLPRRSPQRQAYRLQELARWRDHLGIPIHIQPKFSFQ